MKDHLTEQTCLTPVSAKNIQQVERVFLDILSWPESWMGDEQDRVVGNLILGVLIDYLAHLMDKGRARATVKKHGDYLWALGGEIIRDTNESGCDQNLSAQDLILVYVDSLGGPYWRHANNEDDQRQYDSVCRALYQFLHKT